MKRSFGSIGIGLASVMLIAISLLITVFGALSLVQANADKRLTERSIAAQQAYYRADGQAQSVLAEIDAFVNKGEKPAVEGVSIENECVVFEVQIDGARVLFVAADISGRECRVVEYSIKSVKDWSVGDAVNVFK